MGVDDTAQRAYERQHLTIRLTVDGIAEIDDIAWAEDRSRSQVIRMLLKEALAARKAAGP